jgi:hypothetical protein
MLRLVPLGIAGLLSLVVVGRAADDEPRAAASPDLNANAALKYWRGFANLPRLERDEQDRIMREATTMPLTPRVRAVVTLAESSVHELRTGAAVPRCAWGLTREDGIAIAIPEASASRLLLAIACLRARQRFEADSSAAALDDVFAALTLSRHMGADGLLVSVLLGIGLENTAADVLATYLPKLDAAELKALPARLDKLPPGGTVAAGILLEEKVFLQGFINQVRGFNNRDQLVEYLSQVHGSERDSPKERLAKGEALLRECGGNPGAVIKTAEAARSSYATIAKQTEQWPAVFDKAVAEENQRMEKNPVYRLLFPAVQNCHQLEARYRARRALLRAAIAVQLGGKDALQAHPDPYGAGPFAYEAFDGGFELTSQLEYKEKPVKLTVGIRK